MEILQLVDQFEQTLNRGWRVPLSSSLIVNAEECLRLIDQMRISIPSSIKEGERMVAERDRILSDAQMQAQQIIAHAEQQARQMVSEDAITERAREEAGHISAQGHAEAVRLVDEAAAYARDVLSGLQDHLRGSLHQAENGIKALDSSQAPFIAATVEKSDGEYSFTAQSDDGTDFRRDR